MRRTLIEAAKAGDLDTVRQLVQASTDLGERDLEKGYTALCWAARNGYAEVVQFLIEHGADVDELCSKVSGEVVQFAIEHGASANNSHFGMTAVFKAAFGGHYDVVKILVEKGADIHRDWMNGQTVLHSAVESRSADVVEYLLDRGADIDAFHPGIGTPLAAAARLGATDIVRLLIKRGADVNRQNESDVERYTPLLCVVESLWGERSESARTKGFGIARMLVEAGADLGVRNANGETALDMAADVPDMESLLKRALVRRRRRTLEN